MKKKKRESTSAILKDRSILKQEVYAVTKAKFQELKSVIEKEIDALKEDIQDERVRLIFEEKTDYQVHAYAGSDLLIFNMHSNVFCFPDEHPIQKTSYVEDDFTRAYCGVIHIYNFLADSFLHNRMNDAGYLLGRIFINKENHFMVEGKGQLGMLFRDFLHEELTTEKMHQIVDEAIRHAAKFDLLTPPADMIATISVMQMQTMSSAQQLKTGKRLGFRFNADNDKIF